MLALPPEAIYLDLSRITDDLWYCYCLVTKSSLTLCDPMDSAMLLCPWDFPVKNPGVGCHFLLQGIFLSQGLNPRILHHRQDSIPSEPSEKPILWYCKLI